VREDNVSDLRPGVCVLVSGHKRYDGKIQGKVIEVRPDKVLVHLARHKHPEWVRRPKVKPWVKGNARRAA
jgi:hypothetical protein